MPKHPLAEVFGYPTDNFSSEAVRHRQKRLCPFNNKVPSCTKDKAQDPLGTCSIYQHHKVAITCPIRFREDWLVADDAADFFFPSGTKWTSVTEVRLNDKYGKSAGNIDVVLISYDERGRLTDFGALEVQAVYISGNIRAPFEHYMQNPSAHHDMDWTKKKNYPCPDYLSSSRKRLAPQLIYKGGILHGWNKKMAVAVHSGFFDTLPRLLECKQKEADIAWLVYDLVYSSEQKRFNLVRNRTVFSSFDSALEKITVAEPGPIEDFIAQLQEKLTEEVPRNEPGTPPEARALTDILEQ
ncbi:MAG: hypothetical protein M1343_07940 [Chloroflexi bacterium]|nr:hypothetical protein [Chloroflexota bacterium]